MKIRNFIAFLTLLLSVSAYAEVFKCKVNGKTVYQHDPCAANAMAEGVIKESSPQQVEQDKLKLKAWQDQLAVDEAEKKAAEKQRQDELAKQEALELQKRSVLAQERQAIAAQQAPKTPAPPVYVPAYNWRYWNGGQVPYSQNSPFYPNNGQFYPYYYPRKHHPDQDDRQQPQQHEMQGESHSRALALPSDTNAKP